MCWLVLLNRLEVLDAQATPVMGLLEALDGSYIDIYRQTQHKAY